MSRGEFDPRFDPAFQPGFDPAVHRSRVRAAAPSDTGRLEELFETASGSEPGRAQAGAAASRAVAARSVPTAVAPVSFGATGEAAGLQQLPREETAEAQPGETDPDAPARPNPYIRALWFISIALIVAGIAMYWWAASDTGQFGYDTNVVPIAVILRQLAWLVSPSMMTVGLGGCFALLFWHAMRWSAKGR